ncbi:deleted in malignant brain tumors 1 protein-like [Strongylocentrotus purpuratus]|uniref:SRCR domain-containing protein n=1 Tax=Strongylocentrotus purpuratus TaxID=7668 RepID=A0A7M7PHC3_STRPU|nr:deleted in malignant brain tumors 1 protein-like [Strongylocentrotus purpuratus]
MLRLSNGTGPHEGRVEFFYNGMWNGLCGKKTDASAGNVLCRSLGYDRAFAVLQHGGFGDDTEAFFDGISCPASQSSYQKCRLFKYRSNYCSKDFGHLSISCDIHENIDVRLTGGSGDHEGRVEVFFDQAWGKICANDLWTLDIADVVCRDKGHDRAFIIYYDDTYGQGDLISVQFDEVDCTGAETNLTSCTAYRYQKSFCEDGAFEAASVTCTSSELFITFYYSFISYDCD